MVDGLIQHQQIPLLQHHPFAAAQQVGGGAAAHVHHLHIVVSVFWEPGKAGVAPQLDEFSGLQHFAAVHHKVLLGGVEFPLNGFVALQNGPLLRGDGAELFQQGLPHGDHFLSLGVLYHRICK